MMYVTTYDDWLKYINIYKMNDVYCDKYKLGNGKKVIFILTDCPDDWNILKIKIINPETFI